MKENNEFLSLSKQKIPAENFVCVSGSQEIVRFAPTGRIYVFGQEVETSDDQKAIVKSFFERSTSGGRVVFFVHGGKVRSKHDGDLHYVNAVAVAKLYELNPRDADVRLIEECDRSMKGVFLNEGTHLYPRYEGDYYDARAALLEGEK